MIKTNKLSAQYDDGLSAQYEENVKKFNRMFNDLNPNHFDRFTYLMAEEVVRRVELANELIQKLNEFNPQGDGLSPQYENKLQDVQTWCKERLYCNAVEPRMEWL